ncbi:acyltransferase domain-containing protein [Streptomyces sp. ISL-12]|uniref:acyltransferase domain-containing protein n=1 Tax=Streptomyces sp. ISL-12 TaxID=2819177 RepID=UPI001BEAB601|nr:acyltransferase domain-containing protein [Streptomyces sp. ISL-12]MBT2415278.1 acyltransferase domain-containing protein [Streptomyces sp. ISL-12]
MTEPPPAVLLFPGQGAQQPGMGVGLYHAHLGFRTCMDEVLGLWSAHGFDLRADWLAARRGPEADSLRTAQPLLFSLNWAVGRTVLDAGVRPAALLGHSVGEVAAATLAGVFDPADAVSVMADRIAQLQGTPPGGMLAVQAGPDEVAPYTTEEVVVGAVNAPRQVLLAGPEAGLRTAEEKLRADGFTCRRARALNPFHSPVLTAAALRALPLLAAVRVRPPRLPLHSAYEPGPLTYELARDPRFWALQPARPVLFGPALDIVLADQDVVLAEAGPGQGLTALARRHPRVAKGGSRAIGLLPARPGEPSAERAAFEQALAELAGAPAASGKPAGSPRPAPAGPAGASPAGSAAAPATGSTAQTSRPVRAGLQTDLTRSRPGAGAPVPADSE